MSAWKIAIRELHRLGGGPLKSVKFDRLGPAQKEAVKRLQDLGLVERVGPRCNHSLYQITQLGRDYCEGRAVVVQRNQPAEVVSVMSEPDDDVIEGALLEGGAEVGRITPEALRHLAKTMFHLGRQTCPAH